LKNLKSSAERIGREFSYRIDFDAPINQRLLSQNRFSRFAQLKVMNCFEQPVHVSRRTPASLWQKYRIYSDRLELQSWFIFHTIVIPGREILEIEVRPSVFGGRKGITWGIKLDNADLCRHLLEHGELEAKTFLPQLEQAQVTPWRCSCGCASINFSVQGRPQPSGGIHPIADFLFGTEENLSGIFVFEQSGVLAGLEVYGLAGDAPKSLPSPESLRQLPLPRIKN
jgi:hypothetical protein